MMQCNAVMMHRLPRRFLRRVNKTFGENWCAVLYVDVDVLNRSFIFAVCTSALHSHTFYNKPSPL